MSQLISIIINPSARHPATTSLAETLRERFAAHGAAVDIAELHDCGRLSESARRAAASGAKIVAAVGGDGTVSCVAGAVVGTDAALGVIPLGTLNHFAKDLGIPPDLDAAVATIVAGHVRRVDVGEVNGRVFINNSSLGLYPTMVHHREQQQRLGKRKWSAFMRACWTVLGRYSLIRVSVETDGARMNRKTPLVFVGNNDYHLTGLKLGTRDRLDAGRLAIYLTPDVGRFGLIWFAVRALFGHLRPERDLFCLQATSASINAKGRRVRVAADGEIDYFETPLEYRIRPAALAVVVPAEIPHAPPADVRS
jgi:YegS/Rv2252/BmrU family lipid kinase